MIDITIEAGTTVEVNGLTIVLNTKLIGELVGVQTYDQAAEKCVIAGLVCNFDHEEDTPDGKINVTYDVQGARHEEVAIEHPKAKAKK